LRNGLARAYRATGADPPLGDPARAHGVPFEGYYWRITEPRTGVVVVALGAVCSGPRGPWGFATLAARPGGFVRTTITSSARAGAHAYGMAAERALRGDAAGVAVDMGPDCRLDVSFSDELPWPRRAFGALGPAHAVPFLPQYWHPVVLRAEVRGRVRAGALDLRLDGAVGYAEKNWGGGGFPGHWWWGHADAFGDDVSASFAGGRVALHRATVAPTAVVVRLGRRVIRLAPPAHRTDVALGDGAWRLRTRGPVHNLELEGDAAGDPALELLVPVPGEQRAEPRSRQHLAGRMSLRLRRGRRLVFAGESPLAGLERGLPLSGAPPGGPPG
jgi:tocopherol cyclase